MRYLLLTTVCALAFTVPSFADDHMEDAAMAVEAAAEGVEESTEEMVEAADEMVEEAIEEAGEEVDVSEEEGVLVTDMPAVAPAEVSVIKPVATDWGYTGAKAAPYWGTLNAAYELCMSGENQSPINISAFLQEDAPDLAPAYQPSGLNVVNTGHTIQVNFDGGSTVAVDGGAYNLNHLSFHTPSEHYLDGAPYPMEMHFVHQAEDGSVAVIAVMLKVGNHNPVIEGIWQNAPLQPGEEKLVPTVEFSAGALMPADLEYYKYTGSLTTPPCSEGVTWYVLKTPAELSENQLKAFQALYPVNARPVQPLGERVVVGD